MAKPIIFGTIPGIEEGFGFSNRKEMMPTSFHRKWGSGIDGNKNEGTAAIVLSGGYEDDLDLGNEIIYTGAGGNDPKTKKQIEDQTWNNHGNAGLLISMDQGLPVRVIRGSTHKSEFSPKNGYTYAGLYSVVDAWVEVGKSGFKICRFRLEYCGQNDNQTVLRDIELDYRKREKRKRDISITRYVRDSKIALDIKKLYNFQCQVCMFTIITQFSRYAEGAHIKPLGRPHEGDDNPDNLLCLCPNHHVMFDKGLFSILDNLELTGAVTGKLTIHENHKLNMVNVQYHRKSHGYDD